MSGRGSTLACLLLLSAFRVCVEGGGPACPPAPPPDITEKGWESGFVAEGTARSRSEVGRDGRYGVTFDLGRVLKGGGGRMGRRKQVRLTFTEPANSSSSCLPAVSIRPGRKYLVFAGLAGPNLIPTFAPELANRKNLRALQAVLCSDCGSAPSLLSPREVVLVVKERLRVRCKLRSGLPLPALSWSKDGTPLHPSPHTRLRSKRRQSVLVIRRALESDIGLYRCEGRNAFGTATTTTRVFLPPGRGTRPLPTPTPGPPTTATTLWPIPPAPCPFDSYCLNGGTCNYYTSISEYVCQCAEGYKGQRCDTKEINSGQRAEYEAERAAGGGFLYWS